MKRGYIVGLSFIILLVAVMSASSSYSYVSQTPHGIKGFVLYGDGSQVPAGTSFSVNDTTSGFYTSGTTDGPGSLTGWYSVSINGTDGDLVVIKAWNSTHYGLELLELDKDMQHNITLNVDDNAPYTTETKNEGEERGVWITPDLPANNTDIVCNYEHIVDPDGDSFGVNYTWYKNGIIAADSIHELPIDSNTLFLARFDSSFNADYSGGSGAAKSKGTVSFGDGKIGNGTRFRNVQSDVLVFERAGNLNLSEGTIEFWMRNDIALDHAGSAYYNPFDYGTYYSDGLNVWVYGDGSNMRYQLVVGSSAIEYVYGTVAANESHHIAVTWSSSLTQMYLDGELVARSTSVTSSGISNSYPNFTVGNINRDINEFGTDYNFPGVIDEFRVSDRERTSYEIYRSYADSVILHSKISQGENLSCKVTPTDDTGITGHSVISKSYGVSDVNVDFSFSDKSSNSKNTTLQAGKPVDIDISVKDSLGNSVEGAVVTLTEQNGVTTFGPVQIANTNISNKQIASGTTDSNGFLSLSIIPSGGRSEIDIQELNQFYDVKLSVSKDGKSLFERSLPVYPTDKLLSDYTATYTLGAGLTNRNDLNEFNYYDALVRYYFKVRYFIDGTGGG